MNERIGKLLSRSGGEFFEGWFGSPNTIKFTEDELKTFTELIVRECINQIRNQSMNSGDEWEEGLRIAENSIRENFGVAE